MTSKASSKKSKQAVTPEILLALRKWNIGLAALLAVQAVAIAIIGTDKTVSVNTDYLAADPLASGVAGEQVLAVASRILFDVRIAWAVALFLLVFAAVYLLAATVFRKRYEARLQNGMNDFRWLGLGVGGGMLILTVALISDITSVASLLMLLALMAFGGLAVLSAEELNSREKPKNALLPHVVCAIGFGGFLVSALVLALTASGAWMYDGTVPGYLCAIYAVLVIFFVAGFLLTHYRILRRGRLADTVQSEKLFMLFTALFASIPAWQIFAGVLLP